jgi:trans-aconitate 2-methyltransferase
MSTHRWDAQRYQSQNSFVWQFGEAVIDLLDPQAGERILDLGCGAGQLTAKIAGRGAHVIGLDASPEMIAQARSNFPSLDFRVADATAFELSEPVNAVFSNAALHWVKDQRAAIRCVWRALKPGGRFAAEMGGKGNVQTIVQAAGLNPWFYPSVAEYSALLEEAGFEVLLATLFDRPTRLEGERAMRDWLMTFGSALTEDPDALELRLKPKMYRDGAWTIDYRRLRFLAVK